MKWIILFSAMECVLQIMIKILKFVSLTQWGVDNDPYFKEYIFKYNIEWKVLRFSANHADLKFVPWVSMDNRIALVPVIVSIRWQAFTRVNSDAYIWRHVTSLSPNSLTLTWNPITYRHTAAVIGYLSIFIRVALLALGQSYHGTAFHE